MRGTEVWDEFYEFPSAGLIESVELFCGTFMQLPWLSVHMCS